MTATHNSGPEIIYGAPAAGSTTGSNPEAGPSVTYQGDCILDVRYPYSPGATGVGKVRAYLDSPYELMVDAVPSQIQVANIAAAQNVANGTAMTLVNAASSGISVNMQIVPAGLSTPITNSSNASYPKSTGLISLDFGFTTGNMTAGQNTVSSMGTTGALIQGQPIAIAGAGPGGTPLFTKVLTIASTTSITTQDVAQTSVTGGAIGTANDALTSPDPFVYAGHARVFDPTQGVCRAVSITGSASATGGVFQVRGYDIYGVPMREDITVGAGAVTANGKKAFKYVSSVTPQFADAHNYSVGTTDIYGLNLRSDKWEYANFFWNGAFLTTSTGWTAALANSVAPSATSADARGTYATQSASDGTKRLALFMTLPLYNLIAATPTNPAPLFGQTQYYA